MFEVGKRYNDEKGSVILLLDSDSAGIPFCGRVIVDKGTPDGLYYTRKGRSWVGRDLIPGAIDDETPATDPSKTGFSAGFVESVMMNDIKCLRFYNGMVAALGDPVVAFATTASQARANIGSAMDRLAEAGMVATIGYAGTAIIARRAG